MVSNLTRTDVINPRYPVLNVVTQRFVLSTLAQCCYRKRCVINPLSVLLHKAMCYQPSLSVATQSDMLSTLSQCCYTKRCYQHSLSVATQSDMLSTLAQCCYTKRCVINPRSVLLRKAVCYQPSLSVATESDMLSTLAQCCYRKRCVINPSSVLLHKAMLSTLAHCCYGKRCVINPRCPVPNIPAPPPTAISTTVVAAVQRVRNGHVETVYSNVTSSESRTQMSFVFISSSRRNRMRASGHPLCLIKSRVHSLRHFFDTTRKYILISLPITYFLPPPPQYSLFPQPEP